MTESHREGQGCHPDSGAQRIPMRTTAREPSRLPADRSVPRARHGRRKGWRRSAYRNAGRDPTAEQTAWQVLSLAQGGYVRLQGELPEFTDAGEQGGRPHPEPEFRPHVPRRSAAQEVSLIFRRGLGYFLKVKLDACLQRRLDFSEGRSEDRDVEVHADRFPGVPGTERVATQIQRAPLTVAPGFGGQLRHLGRLPHRLDRGPGRGLLPVETT